MTRGHYLVRSALGTACGHRHYDLSRALWRCWSEDAGNTLVYVWPDGRERPSTGAERAELRALVGVPPAPGRPPSTDGRGRGSSSLYVRLSHDERARVDEHCEREGTTAPRLVRERLRDVIDPRG